MKNFIEKPQFIEKSKEFKIGKRDYDPLPETLK